MVINTKYKVKLMNDVQNLENHRLVDQNVQSCLVLNLSHGGCPNHFHFLKPSLRLAPLGGGLLQLICVKLTDVLTIVFKPSLFIFPPGFLCMS